MTSIPAMVWEGVVDYAERPIMREKRRGIWQTITWADLGRRMRAIGQALRADGLASGDRVCVLSETRPEWVYADLGIQGAGGVAVGIYASTDAELVAEIVRECGARVLFVENEEQLDKALQAREACPTLERIVVFDMKGLRELTDPMCESLEAFLVRGEGYDVLHAREWEAGIEAIRSEDLAALIFTAGTTGSPKGVMLSHANILAQVGNAASLLGQTEADRRLVFMPMGHVMERVLGLYLSLYTRAVGNYVESLDTVAENLQEVRPTVLLGTPHVWERFHTRISLGMEGATLLQRALFRWAMAAGRRRAARRSAWTALEGGALSWLVLRNARRELGLDRLRITLIGGAAVSDELIRWFAAFGIELTEIYGQTESGGLVALGGRPAPHAEIAVPEDEVLVRGAHVFMGYWNRPEETARALRGGWLHTGDIGSLGAEGLAVAGRRQEIITTADGTAVAAGAIEKELKLSPYIADAMLLGEERAHLSCLVLIEHDAVEKWAHAHNVMFTSFATLVRAEEVRGLIGAEIERLSTSRGTRIGAFRLLDQRLEPEDPELSPVMKLRRGIVGEKYRELIEEMYGSP